MTSLLVLTTVLVCGLAVIGFAAYVAAIRRGYRAYRHVSFAFAFVLGISITSGVALADESELLRLAHVSVNLIGIAAMLDLIVRFRHPSVGAVRKAARADEEAEDARKLYQRGLR